MSSGGRNIKHRASGTNTCAPRRIVGAAVCRTMVIVESKSAIGCGLLHPNPRASGISVASPQFRRRHL